MKKLNVSKAILLTVGCCQLFFTGCGSQTETFSLKELETEAFSQENDWKCTEEETSVMDDGDAVIVIYVCGAVESAGVYELPEGSRVYEVIQMAGGYRKDAAEESINQARVLIDGEQIWIPTKEEAEEGIFVDNSVTLTADGGQVSGRINLNTATAEELMSLSGIGNSKAQAIITYREEHGGFGSTEELMNISGIGEHTYEKIKEQISVR